MYNVTDSIQIGISGLLLGLVIGTKLTPSDGLYLWLIVGILANTSIVAIRAARR